MVQRLADNVTLTLVARFAMVAAPIVVGIAGVVATNYLEAQNKALDVLSGRVQAIESSGLAGMAIRISVLETTVATNITADERYQTAATVRLNSIQDSLVVLSTSVAAVRATLDTILPVLRGE